MAPPSPKAYLPLGGVPLLRHSLHAFVRHPAIDCVRAVIHPGDRSAYDEAAHGLDLLDPVPGGTSRQDSVRAGLESLIERHPGKVLIHDGARPFPDAALIQRVVTALDEAPAVIAAVPMVDSLKRSEDGRIAASLDRHEFWRAQTPQGFDFQTILDAHRTAATASGLGDDAEVAERAGIAVDIVAGSEDNLKITTPHDLARAERMLLGHLGDVRCASGFDTHRFGPNPSLDGVVRLCGVDIPFDKTLSGHSDADVGLHALADALLGAIGAGDIGAHFPPDEPEWAGADSGQFVEHAAGLIAARQGRITHVDLTLICEAPKLAPHRAAMVASIAVLLGLEEDRVSVKATTTEKLGFTGRGEGIAAQALVTVRLPV